MKKYLKTEKLIYFGIFIFFLILLTLSPISGDDWGNYLEGSEGLYHCFSEAVGMYFGWEGRLVSRVLINILTYYKWLWNVINSILITGIIFNINRFINPNHKKRTLLLTLLTILLMNIYSFSQVIVWVAGNITYLFPLSFLLFYIYELKNYKEKNSKIFESFMLLSNILIPMFVEHMAVLLIIINIVFLFINYHKTKKWNIKIIIWILLSIISTLSMFLAPGNIVRRKSENTLFNEMSLFEKAFYNIPNFIYYTFITNSYLLVLLMITSIIQVSKINNKFIIKIGLLAFLLVIPLLTVLTYNLNEFILLPSFFLKFIDFSNRYIQIYWIGFIIIHFYLLLRDKSIKHKDLIIIFTILGVLANSIMLLSPVWGYRTSFASYIFLIIPQIMIIDEIKLSKIIESIIMILTILAAICFIIFYSSIRIEQNKLEKSIKTQLKENKDIIEVESFPNYANCNINPTNSFHLTQFKRYYNIPLDKEVVVLPKNWRYIIIK